MVRRVLVAKHCLRNRLHRSGAHRTAGDEEPRKISFVSFANRLEYLSRRVQHSRRCTHFAQFSHRHLQQRHRAFGVCSRLQLRSDGLLDVVVCAQQADRARRYGFHHFAQTKAHFSSLVSQSKFQSVCSNLNLVLGILI